MKAKVILRDGCWLFDLVVSKVVDGTLQYDALTSYNRYVNQRYIKAWLRRHTCTTS